MGKFHKKMVKKRKKAADKKKAKKKKGGRFGTQRTTAPGATSTVASTNYKTMNTSGGASKPFNSTIKSETDGIQHQDTMASQLSSFDVELGDGDDLTRAEGEEGALPTIQETDAEGNPIPREEGDDNQEGQDGDAPRNDGELDQINEEQKGEDGSQNSQQGENPNREEGEEENDEINGDINNAEERDGEMDPQVVEVVDENTQNVVERT